MLKTGGVDVHIGNLDNPERHQAQAPVMAPVDHTARDIINLTKMITTDNKYSGQGDNFDFKLTIFNNHCNQLGITNDATKAKAYSNMLKETALQHYLTNKVNSDARALATGIPESPTFTQLCQLTRNYFENDEYRRSQLQLFNGMSLKQVINDPKNADKSQKECLLLLVANLRDLQNSLDSQWHIDSILLQRLITACQDIPACSLAFQASNYTTWFDQRPAKLN